MSLVSDASSAAGEPPPEFGSRLEDLAWIDEFAANVRPYVRARPEDGALIKMPLEAYQVNPTGARLLQRALAGEPIRSIALAAGAEGRPERIAEIHAFFCDVRDLLSNRLGDGSGRRATAVSPFTGSFTRFPVLSEIALTYRCNLACRFCYAGCGQAADSPPRRGGRLAFWRRQSEMTARQVMRVTDILAREAKVPSLSFTGGEPTLRSDLPRFVAHAARRGLRVNLITNGVLCADERLPRALARAGLSSAQVSIEGPDAETHDSLTRRPGSFDLSLRGLRNLRAAGVKTHCNTTVCRANAGRLEAIADLAASLHLERISMNLIIPAGTSAAEGAEALQVRYREIGPLALAAKARAEALGLEFHWYSPTPMCLFNPIAHALGNKGCAACDGLIHVAPDGRVLPCSSFRPEESVGDLLRDGFEAVWFGEKAQFFKTKRQAPSGCRSCDRFALCQGACPLYWREMGCEELEHAAMRMEAAES